MTTPDATSDIATSEDATSEDATSEVATSEDATSDTAATMDSMTRALPVGIVADDLTGANDSAVQFARGGWQARLLLGDPAAVTATAGTVLAVVTDARAEGPTAARAHTAAAVSSLRAAGIDRLFVKIDSTMRGSVSAQIAGALDAWGDVHPNAIAVVCPAYPAMGRTVERGLLLVDGAGVETTSVGRDPVTPVMTSALGELLPHSTAVSIEVADAAALARRIDSLSTAGARVITVDAATDGDLRVIGDALVELGPRAVPVGSAGLAVVMSTAWGSGSASAAPARGGSAGAGAQESGAGVASGAPHASEVPGRVIVQISSLHDASRDQHAHLVDSHTGGAAQGRVRTFAPTLGNVSGTDAAAAWIARELAAQPELPQIVVVLAPVERDGDAKTEPDVDADHGDAGTAVAHETAAERVAAGLAAVTDALVGSSPPSALVLVGGEGARAVLDRFAADSILVTDAIREGIPIGVIEGGRLHGVTVVTKAGGFGTPASLTEILPELLGHSAHELLAHPAHPAHELPAHPAHEPTSQAAAQRAPAQH